MQDMKRNLIRGISSLRTGEDYPVWLDGLYNVLALGETSHRNDNPYMPFDVEESLYKQYRDGAMAGELLRKAIREQGGE